MAGDLRSGETQVKRSDDAVAIHLDQMRRTISTIGSLPTDSLTPKMEKSLLGAFRRWKETPFS